MNVVCHYIADGESEKLGWEKGEEEKVRVIEI